MNKDTQKRFRNIILIGMPASGKSSFGKAYAIHTGRYFLDFDKYFEMVTKKKIVDIFEKEGEEIFRNMENMILKKLEKKHNYVIALGGGTICSSENFEFARRLGLIVFLQASPQALAQRILSDQINKINNRPLFLRLNNLSEIQEKIIHLWELRQEFYEKAYIHLNTEFSSLDNLKLQLGLYEKKSIEREQFKEKNQQRFARSQVKNKNIPPNKEKREAIKSSPEE